VTHPLIGHNNPPPDEPRDPLFDMDPNYLQHVILNRARPVALREICARLAAPKLGELVSQIYDAMLGPSVNPRDAAVLMRQLTDLLPQPGRAADERRRALQRKRQSRPQYKQRERERERGYRAARSANGQ